MVQNHTGGDIRDGAKPSLASNTDENSFITRSRATNVCEGGGRDEALRTSALKTKLSLKSNS